MYSYNKYGKFLTKFIATAYQQLPFEIIKAGGHCSPTYNSE